MTHATSLESTLLIAAAALLCAGLQLAGIDSLAAPHRAPADRQVVQLPTVLVTAERATARTAVQRLPQVVIVGQRDAAAQTVTAQTRDAAPAI